MKKILERRFHDLNLALGGFASASSIEQESINMLPTFAHVEEETYSDVERSEIVTLKGAAKTPIASVRKTERVCDFMTAG
ncbi:hypothetical protein FRC20_008157 [Serendipita sp. 405]|nr:hypothetical protein FRC20_008157 [Serendipita sp. 405]